MSEAPAYKVRLPDGSEYGPGPMELLVQWAREGRVPRDAVIVAVGGAERPVLEVEELAAHVMAPPTISTGVRPADDDGTLSGIIPYRNPTALVGYYLAVFALIPGLGLLLGPAAVVCGIIGFRKGCASPTAKGRVHAWVAIILGALATLGYWALATVLLVVAA